MRSDLGRQLRAALWSGALVAAGACLVAASGVLAPIDRSVGDALVRLGAGFPPPLPATEPDVAVVAVDARSLRAFPEWPWPRGLYARAIDRLAAAGARAIAFDIDFSTPRDRGEDAELAAAIATSGRVVLAAFRQSQSLPGGGELEIANLPVEPLAEAAAGLGSVLVPTETDGVVRRAPRASAIGARPIPSLAWAALAVANGEPRSEPEPGHFTVDYRRARPLFPVISIAELIEGRFDPRDIAGRVVFIGATAAEFQDLWTTPLGPAQPGVFIQATAARTLAARAAGQPVLRPLATAHRYALITLISLLTSLLMLPPGGAGHAWRVTGLLAMASTLLAGTIGLAVNAGLILCPALPLAVIAAHYVLGIESVRRRFRRRIEAHDSSLAALTRVGEAATHGASKPSQAGDGLEVALALLGEVVDASGVALLHADAAGCLDGRRRDWRPERQSNERRKIGDDDLAAAVLATSERRIFASSVPGGADDSMPGGSAIYTPLSAGGSPVGVLIVEREGSAGLDETRLRTIATAGTQLALSAQNLRLLEELRETFSSSMAAVAAAVEARDGYTDLHCRRLSAFSCIVAEQLGLERDEIKAIELGALLHDVGKIGIRDAVLNKPGRFTPEERAEMEQHPIIGARIIGSVRGLHRTTLHCVRHHHERWDGLGYPDRLADEAIPLAARIVSVVDVWDALSSHRPYKKPLPQERTLELLVKQRGQQFDPEIVDLFIRVWQDQGDEMLTLIDRDGREAAP